MTRAASIRSKDKLRAAPSVAARVRLQLLNTPRLLLATGGVYVLERKEAALLALLATEGSAPRTRAAALLWADIDENRARNNLRQRLFRLRRAATSDVVRAGPVLSLAESVAHDLDALAPRLAADPDAATGELLGKLDYGDCAELLDWVEAAREKWRQARRAALAEVDSRLEAEGHVGRSLRYAQRLVGDDPSLEHAHRRVMRLHYLRGDRAAALAAYERCCEALREHVGARPGKETLELARLIEDSGTLATSATPLAPRPVAVLRPPRLVGREVEWAQLERAWDARRIVIASGEPGIGKTRLLTDFASTRRSVIAVGARPGDARVPYALLARWLRACVAQFAPPAETWVIGELARIAPELGAVADGKADPLRLRQAMLSALAAWTSA
ncbi:MAG: BTAD domain-containing putative transcriptional regulator, partial [Gemmatimonadota bacterium]